MTETRFPPWMCWRCGYMMDAASDVTGNDVPKEGDASLCLNCGAPYILRGGRWVAMTAAERAALPQDVHETMSRLDAARRGVVKDDLSKRGGRA